MKIQVLSVSVTTKTSKAGKPFQSAEVAYKNLDQGKVESKNITQYSDVFKQVVDAQTGSVYDVTNVKDDNGYWQWTSFKQGVPGETAPAGAVNKATPSPKSTYETPEERAKRQVYIIKQSSLSSAIALLSVGAKAPPTVEQVKLVAQQFVDFVFEDKKDNLFDLPNDVENEVF
jgi:hypothetical protein